MDQAQQAILDEFQDVVGNKLTILTMTYQNCRDTNKYPFEELELMRECAGRVFLAIGKFMGQTWRPSS